MKSSYVLRHFRLSMTADEIIRIIGSAYPIPIVGKIIAIRHHPHRTPCPRLIVWNGFTVNSQFRPPSTASLQESPSSSKSLGSHCESPSVSVGVTSASFGSMCNPTPRNCSNHRHRYPDLRILNAISIHIRRILRTSEVKAKAQHRKHFCALTFTSLSFPVRLVLYSLVVVWYESLLSHGGPRVPHRSSSPALLALE